ncbi:DNA alkylation repair protein [Nocardiopsis lambiniae]|uniref:DNA alkylation repair protein n=1 Tax=Nocardiopsis lambiniae TaxID=3075539 RepID=A0ABU2M908_9ACTN|nr:DNA alkylation repair protein [Nocardiopsis sp. DSM 44743]MDT0329149.1 DNA alkylation repair protein [Nocardiopsis sp. DSM 44743]
MTDDHSLKRHIDGEAARLLGKAIRERYPDFDVEGYAAEVDARVGPLELKDRVMVMAESLRARLPASYPDAVAVLVASLGEGLVEGGGMYGQGFHLMAVARFVEEYGVAHPEASLPALVEITRRHTSEFAVRPFLVHHREATLALMRDCALDPDPNVRRFAGEGMRPRLPWARRMTDFVTDPGPVLEVLESLRNDPSAYVRTSVANNLNDVSRDHPDRVLDLAERWLRESPTPETAWTVRHALRTLVKKGDQRALALLGATGGEHVRAEAMGVSPAGLDLGGTLTVRVDLVNADDRPHTVIVDYRVHYVRADGTRRPKVFKWTTVELCAGERRTLEKRHRVRPISTRAHHPGEHLVEVQVNGVIKGAAPFELRVRPAGERP